jgi:hypothetical protein
MKTILIYDDNGQIAKELEEGLAALPVLEKEFEITVIDDRTFTDSIEILQKRRGEVRKNGTWPDGGPIPLDKADIFVIDYDLFDTNAFLTGEDVAYSVRCFSTCGLIVALNQYYEVDFDLTLKGHPESFADLNITGNQLKNPNLWGSENEEEFRPWYWPLLPAYQQDYEQRVEDVRQNLNSPICQVLGFDPELFDILPRSITQFIGQEPVETTFRQFVLESGNGMNYKDYKDPGNVSEEILVRVGAARIAKWLERLVLPELDILVDAPHLVSRYPSLMTGAKEVIETWNKTTQLSKYTELGLKTDKIEQFRFEKEFWLSRPAWFWDGVRECEAIEEVREPWTTKRPNWVFCEDISKFYDGECHEFVAEVESPFARRFVKRLDNIKYQPRVRFSF